MKVQFLKRSAVLEGEIRDREIAFLLARPD